MVLTQGLFALSSGHSFCRCAGAARRVLLALLVVGCAGGIPALAAEGPSAAPAPTKTADPKSDIPQVGIINAQIRRQWASNMRPSSPASDGEWCRRAFLDVLGRIPTVDELKRFLDEPARDRKSRLANRLLGDAYVEDYARNWTTLWTNVLIGRSGGTELRSLVNRDGLQQALRRAFQHNTPYDRLVFDLVSATGVSKPGEEGFNGFVNFLAGNLQENGVQATAKTAQIFLGLQIQCTQCHNHPFNDWKQNQFWEMNAFFRQTRALRRFEKGREVAAVELINQDFAGENNKPEEAVLFYELRNGLSKAALPVFVDGAKLKSDSGYVQEVDRRAELAKLVVSSDYLAKALINRVWAHFLGYGFTKPVDDMGPHNPPSHPELLDAFGWRIQSPQLQSKGIDSLDSVVRSVRSFEPIRCPQQDGRSGAGRETPVQPLLFAADAGRRTVRVAAGGHRGPKHADQL